MSIIILETSRMQPIGSILPATFDNTGKAAAMVVALKMKNMVEKHKSNNAQKFYWNFCN